jgi:hypothetical protein
MGAFRLDNVTKGMRLWIHCCKTEHLQGVLSSSRYSCGRQTIVVSELLDSAGTMILAGSGSTSFVA